VTTYLDLQTRIIAETNRDDLSDVLAAQLTLHIARAIEFYADHRFWFNEAVLTGVCVANNAYANVPTTMRTLDRVNVTVGGANYPLKKRDLTWIDDVSTPLSKGPPTDFAQLVVGGVQQIRQYPTPNSAYALGFIGIVNLSTLANPTDTNDWLGPGYDLITERTKRTLFERQFYDATKAASAAGAEAEALSKLTGETAKRLGTGRMRSSW